MRPGVSESPQPIIFKKLIQLKIHFDFFCLEVTLGVVNNYTKGCVRQEVSLPSLQAPRLLPRGSPRGIIPEVLRVSIRAQHIGISPSFNKNPNVIHSVLRLAFSRDDVS